MQARSLRILPALLMVALLGGCGLSSSVGTADAQAPAYKVTIQRNGEMQQLPPLKVVSTDQKTVLGLYRAMLAVKPQPNPFIYMCPMDLGVTYTVIFDLPGKVLKATVDGSGCQFIHLPGKRTLWSSGKSGDAFWAEMGKVLQMTRQELRG